MYEMLIVDLIFFYHKKIESFFLLKFTLLFQILYFW